MSSNHLRVNGRARRVGDDDSETRTLLSVLRDELHLTGTKYGCGEGQCGACTVLVDDVPTRSCTTALSQAIGTSVATIEGLARGKTLHPVQQAFLEVDALQCGYCTPGMIMSAVGLLHQNPHPTRQQIIEAMQGNICRCGCYQRIVAAVERAAGMTNGRAKAAAGTLK